MTNRVTGVIILSEMREGRPWPNNRQTQYRTAGRLTVPSRRQQNPIPSTLANNYAVEKTTLISTPQTPKATASEGVVNKTTKTNSLKKPAFKPEKINQASRTPTIASRPKKLKTSKSSAKMVSKPNQRQLLKLAKSARALMVLEKSVAKDKKPSKLTTKLRQKAKKLKSSKRKILTQAAAAALLIFALYTVADTYITNHRIKEDLQKSVAAAQSSDDPNSRQEAEGKDELAVDSSAIDNYKVAAEMPRILTIKKISVRARILPMSVNPDGSMQAPINVFDAGWYTGSVRPGQVGASTIVAHAYGPTLEGLFYHLKDLESGDIITVERGDGQKLNYQVVAKETTALDQVDMNKFMRPAEGVDEGLNLMTCTGKWVPASKTYDHREIIYTKRVE